MNTDNLMSVIVFLVIGIVVLAVLGSMTSSRFMRTTNQDQFRNKKQIGNQNLGKIKEEKTYRQIAKSQNLEEAKLLEKKLNPKVTRSIAVVTKDVRKKEK